MPQPHFPCTYDLSVSEWKFLGFLPIVNNLPKQFAEESNRSMVDRSSKMKIKWRSISKIALIYTKIETGPGTYTHKSWVPIIATYPLLFMSDVLLCRILAFRFISLMHVISIVEIGHIVCKCSPPLRHV